MWDVVVGKIKGIVRTSHIVESIIDGMLDRDLLHSPY
jgi:hypothetical protein